MKFSIIIPLFNAEQYLAEVINSVLDQSHNEYEILLINDGSTDNSATMCDLYQKQYKHIIRVIHQENKGQLAARCTGIENAQGEYCIFLDADDLLDKYCLKKIDEAVENYNKPELIIFSLLYKTEEGLTRKSKFSLEDRKLYTDKSKVDLYQCFFNSTELNSMCTKAISTNVAKQTILEAQKFTHLKSGEDRLQSMMVLDKSKTILALDEALYIYRMFQGSTTRTFSISTIDRFNMSILCNIEEQYASKWKIDDEITIKKIEATFLNHAMYIFVKYYLNILDKKERKSLILFNWTSFVKMDYLDKINDNPYVNEFYKKLWENFTNKEYFLLRCRMFRHKVYIMMRNWKRAVLK